MPRQLIPPRAPNYALAAEADKLADSYTVGFALAQPRKGRSLRQVVSPPLQSWTAQASANLGVSEYRCHDMRGRPKREKTERAGGRGSRRCGGNGGCTRSGCYSPTVRCFAAARRCNLVRSGFRKRTFAQCSPSRLRRTAAAQQHGSRASAHVACTASLLAL